MTLDEIKDILKADVIVGHDQLKIEIKNRFWSRSDKRCPCIRYTWLSAYHRAYQSSMY
ncbi:MAG: hypothetical protein J7L53_05925 [Deltaproteobacteria bacterium]|nr:hypothetical protein [Deltaproteobacteria bacterium]